ncbi:AAA family ATPase [Stutzerimonas xanthomarina]|uniref:AAA ATPase domain-containing protein n=2 Tax=Stutzerimonas xanthomarina TaxID=271420 RepID=A0A1M5SCB3_9GAMM|nr:AAA family ATPase [Stutzerimonas xanthomarina]MCP9340122.1 AAA family ATPase [Stutzerimonas xanthomarina]SEH99640.1 AAA ATPase domain-containing protein [Stutzerimonas xanthomarina]SHH36156.1 AAA ATPase domain-containing protein [Stutzerimonas xanthomarina DSM 18231]
MKIVYIDIQNYRKLKSCRISLTEAETLLVGANNSGKTSAMDALIFFLDQKGRSAASIASGEMPVSRKLSATDFTLSNWHQLNEFGRAWAAAEASGDQLGDWQPLCPTVDIWLQVEKNEIHRVSHLIPTLKWDGGLLGVRMIYQPKDLDTLKSDFVNNYNAAEQLKKIAQDNAEAKRKELGKQNGENPTKFALEIWPSSLREYLDREAGRAFELKSYILDPGKVEEVPEANYKPQELTEGQVALEFYPFNGLFKVDIIDATRGFTDPNAATVSQANSSNLAGQINKYYNRHLNPTDLPGVEDLEALEAIALAQHSFDGRLNDVFTKPLGEIKTLGYPGFNDPHIRLSSKVNPIDNLDHEAAILFEIQKASLSPGAPLLSLSEKYNGLGYKNLIAMVFKLMSFRDQWMRVGKAGKRKPEDDAFIEPLHLVLIEEPEAHLHAQVQQVFIKKAYSVLRNHADLLLKKKFSSQLIVSTHSSYLAHEIGFEKLRYFKRKPAGGAFEVPTAEVIDLSATFGTSKTRSEEILQTAQFVARYLKTTHCDLFFANGIILVEGAAERLLIPHFIRNNINEDTSLDNSYISILEVGGAHAHRLRALIDKLGLPTLVITDTDAMQPPPADAAPKAKAKSIRPALGKGYKTGSHTITKWLAVKDPSLDAVLAMKAEEKVVGKVRIAFQYGIPIVYADSSEALAIPYTFEDAIALTNPVLFKGLVKPTGMIKKMQTALNLETLELCCEALYDALAEDKAEMALDLLFCAEPTDLAAPAYIQEGLDWLKKELDVASEDLVPGVVEPV